MSIASSSASSGDSHSKAAAGNEFPAGWSDDAGAGLAQHVAVAVDENTAAAPAEGVEAWGDEEFADEPLSTGDQTTALVGSVLVHLIVILMLALLPLSTSTDEEAVVIVSSRPRYEEEARLIEEVTYSEIPHDEIGANSVDQFEMAAASAEMFAEVAEIPSPVELLPTELGQIMVNNTFTQAVAPLDRLENQKGKVGQGTQGVSGAVDRITFEILQSVEQRPTLVVWLFDQSGSLHRQRKQIRDRFDRIYEELGVVAESQLGPLRRNENEVPILTSIIGFGSGVTLYTEQPTDDLQEIKSIVDSIQVDSSGVERVFAAVDSAANEFKSYRRSRGPNGPQRNVMFVVVTDERGDDTDKLEPAIASCRKWGISVSVIGVPSPFGQETTLVKYVDPDPEFDQTPRWAEVDQGPESLLPELVRVGFTGNFGQEPVIDSGFGPYALTRLCYETGGIYFAVHPNRNVSRQIRRREIDAYAADLEYFFDPAVMSRYRPDYLSATDYLQRVSASPLRQALVAAARMQPAAGLSRPRTRFVKRNDAQLVGELNVAQQDAARLEPNLNRIAQTLEPGLSARESETSPRWEAGFDLALGRVLAQKVRTETYNAMLAKAKRGMAFADPKHNTWVLKPSDEISVGSKWEREADEATALLNRVVSEHAGTPWALLAKQELGEPIGWEWTEEFTDLAPPATQMPGNNNNNPRPPQDDQKRMIKQLPKRPVPKL